MIIVHDKAYENWVFDAHHPTQGRRFIKGYESVMMHASDRGLAIEVVAPSLADWDDLLQVHDPYHLNQVLNEGRCDEWTGHRFDLGRLAALFAGGTLTALDHLLSGLHLTAIHLPGAKHHAQFDRSSGFCVFADFAMAAHKAVEHGERVAIFDFDAHHGDGTENLTRDNPSVLTFSVHQRDIFPYTGNEDEPANHVYNEALPAWSSSGDLFKATDRFIELAQAFGATMIFVAAGADGLVNDPLSNLEYTRTGLMASAGHLRDSFPHTPILMGGAGGYLPDGGTPLAWGAVAASLGARSERSDLHE